MAKVKCVVEETKVENDEGRAVPGVCATCSRCDEKAEAYGTGPASRRRALVKLRENCPENEENFYIDADED